VVSQGRPGKHSPRGCGAGVIRSDTTIDSEPQPAQLEADDGTTTLDESGCLFNIRDNPDLMSFNERFSFDLPQVKESFYPDHSTTATPSCPWSRQGDRKTRGGQHSPAL
jgi:hypothetical protein